MTLSSQISETLKRAPKPPKMRHVADFKLLPDLINGRWSGIESGTNAKGDGLYYNAWMHFPDLKQKAWQQLGFPFKSEADAIEYLRNYQPD